MVCDPAEQVLDFDQPIIWFSVILILELISKVNLAIA